MYNYLRMRPLVLHYLLQAEGKSKKVTLPVSIPITLNINFHHRCCFPLLFGVFTTSTVTLPPDSDTLADKKSTYRDLEPEEPADKFCQQ